MKGPSQILEHPEVDLRQILLHAYEMCPFYREKFSSIGLSQNDLTAFSMAQLSRLPSVTEQDLRKSWQELSVIDHTSFRATTSGGTTGLPKLMVRSRIDWDVSVDSHVEVLTTSGLQSSHRLLVAVPFDLWSIGFLTMDACKRIGCMAIPVGVHMSDEAVLSLAEMFRVDAVFTTPSRWDHISNLVAKRPVADSGMLMLLAGEVIPAQTRQRLTEFWGGPVRGVYGSEETDGLGSECGLGPDGMHILTNRFLFEVLDHSTGKSYLNEGRGELVITSLYHRGTPLIRYQTGDFVEINTSRCPCGRLTPKIQVFGKTGEVVILRDATRLYGYQIQEAIEAALGTDLPFQVIIRDNTSGDAELLEIKLPNNSITAQQAKSVETRLLLEHQDIADSVALGVLKVTATVGSILRHATLKDKQVRLVDLRLQAEQKPADYN